MTKNLARLLAALVLIAGATACTYPVFYVGQRGPSHPESPPASATVFVKATPESAAEPENGDLRRKIARLAKERGFVEAPEETADLILLYEYQLDTVLKRIHLRPITAAVSGITTTREEGPFDHSVSLWLIDGPGYRENGREEVVWLGGAAIPQTPTTSARFVDLVIVQAMRNFPQVTDGTKQVKMGIDDARAKKLRE